MIIPRSQVPASPCSAKAFNRNLIAIMTMGRLPTHAGKGHEYTDRHSYTQRGEGSEARPDGASANDYTIGVNRVKGEKRQK